MAEFIITEIQKDELLDKVQNNLSKGGRLVAINGYVNSNGENVVEYTLEYECTRERLIIKAINEIPTITKIYKGAAWFEEEIQEMMPVRFLGLKSTGRLFLPDEFNEGEGKILILPLDELKKLKEK